MENYLNEITEITNLIGSRFDYILTGYSALSLLINNYNPNLLPDLPISDSIELVIDNDFEKSSRKGIKIIYENEIGEYKREQTCPMRRVSFKNPTNGSKFYLIKSYISKDNLIKINNINVIKPEILLKNYENDLFLTDEEHQTNGIVRNLLNQIINQ